MGIRYRREKGKSVPNVNEFVVKNRKEIRYAVRDVADISKNVKSIVDHIRKELDKVLEL